MGKLMQPSVSQWSYIGKHLSPQPPICMPRSGSGTLSLGKKEAANWFLYYVKVPSRVDWSVEKYVP